MIKHIVMWNMAGDTKEDRRKAAEFLRSRFEELRGEVPGSASSRSGFRPQPRRLRLRRRALHRVREPGGSRRLRDPSRASAGQGRAGADAHRTVPGRLCGDSRLPFDLATKERSHERLHLHGAALAGRLRGREARLDPRGGRGDRIDPGAGALHPAAAGAGGEGRRSCSAPASPASTTAPRCTCRSRARARRASSPPSSRRTAPSPSAAARPSVSARRSRSRRRSRSSRFRRPMPAPR